MTSDEELWTTTDPLGRTIHFREDIRADRAAAGKHPGPDAMSTDEVRELITSPSRIDESSKSRSRNVYYRYKVEAGVPPYHHAIVEFADELYSPDGVVISWSKIRKPVSGRTIFIDPRNNP